jgi:hypothetical protein
VKPRSPLETLKDVRQRARDSEQARLVGCSRAEKQAAAAEARARQALLDQLSEAELARRTEDQRLEAGGITAAEGQRRLAWESAQRQVRENLSVALERAVASHREASRQHDLARSALQRADAELGQVERPLQRREHARLRQQEQAQQDTQDEASARAFSERKEA